MNSESFQPLYYQPSGKAPVPGILLMLGFGLGAGLAGGALYGLINFYNPVAFLNCLLCLGLAVVLGVAVSMGGTTGKIRNRKVTVIIAVITALFTSYIQWLVYVALSLTGSFGENLLALITSPGEMLGYMGQLMERGWNVISKHSNSGSQMSGLPVLAAWIAETGILIHFTRSGASDFAGEPYSETCDDWMERKEYLFLDAPADYMMLESRLRSGDIGPLLERGPITEASEYAFKLDLYSHPGDAVDYLTVTRINVKDTNDTLVLAQYLAIPITDALQILKHMKAVLSQAITTLDEQTGTENNPAELPAGIPAEALPQQTPAPENRPQNT